MLLKVNLFQILVRNEYYSSSNVWNINNYLENLEMSNLKVI